jgi:hypothetical protein
MFKRHKEPTSLDEAIEEVYREMKGVNSDSKEYARMTKQLRTLHKLKAQEKPKRGPSSDTVAVVVGNLAGIALIVFHERAAVITTKAFSQLLRPR